MDGRCSARFIAIVLRVADLGRYGGEWCAARAIRLRTPSERQGMLTAVNVLEWSLMVYEQKRPFLAVSMHSGKVETKRTVDGAK